MIEETRASGLDGETVPMEHDFFTKQPVIRAFANTIDWHLPILLGARAYCKHSCLRNWPDYKVQGILTKLTPRLIKGDSKLLCNENMIPDKDAHWLSTAMDMVLMINFPACERTDQNWRGLLGLGSYKIVKI